MENEDTDTNKHIKIGVLNLFSFKTPISSRLCDRRRGAKMERRQRERVETRSRASGKAM